MQRPTGANEAEPLAHQMQRMARQLQGQSGLDSTLRTMVSSAAQVIPGVEHAGVTMVRHGRRDPPLGLRYATDPLACGVERAQYDECQGPSLEAAYRRTTIRMVDSCGEERWPAFIPQARTLGVRSMLCLPMHAGARDLYSLNLYSCLPGAFEGNAEQVARLFIAHAVIAVQHVSETEQLHTAIESRDVIGQAKGILMQRYKITADQAFYVLKHSAAETNTKLRDVADQLAVSGALPEAKKSRT